MAAAARSSPAEPPPVLTQLAAALGPAECRFARQPGGTAYFCVWTYPYRAPEAADAFRDLSDALGACLGSRATMRGDPAVNHPDSYESREFLIDDESVTVSLKDKAALGKSLIFLRVMVRRDDR